MNTLENSFTLNLEINPSLYIKNPQDSKLGKKIIQKSVQLIHDLGFDQFNFKKLAKAIGSTETSIYRYFENKHKLFVYLLNWYWEWMIVRIDFNTLNITDTKRKIELIIEIIIDTANRNTQIPFIDEDLLHEIVVREGTKGYHSINVDNDNEEGFFLAYKRLCAKIQESLVEYSSKFEYPYSLASMLIETANNNIYFSKHLPRLTDIKAKEKSKLELELKKLLMHFIFAILDKK